jgi:hypothetical protein
MLGIQELEAVGGEVGEWESGRCWRMSLFAACVRVLGVLLPPSLSRLGTTHQNYPLPNC